MARTTNNEQQVRTMWGRNTGALARMMAVAAGLLGLCGAAPLRAQDSAPLQFYEIETKYIFGFTEGSGIGLEGEKEFSLETVARIGKAGGRYWASETKLEYEF